MSPLKPVRARRRPERYVFHNHAAWCHSWLGGACNCNPQARGRKSKRGDREAKDPEHRE